MTTHNEYDAVPYESYPYAQTDPDHLYTIGHLFSIGPVAPTKCRVLELGCASGGNLIPMAIRYPNSHFVGIDLSQVQIDEGQKHIKNLGLTNIELKQLSILDMTKDFGQFDYIIVHGILSWVPKEVQDKIFEVCSQNLSPKGIAYISYNTLPGWNMIKSIREMMLYHTSRFEDPTQKASEARKLLEFIREGNGTADSAYKAMIESEIKILRGCGDSYLMHDHMEAYNEPFYFYQIAEKATRNGLQYLGDTSVPSMYQGRLPETTKKILDTISHDVVKMEQYIDFISNRRFRSTLLCHQGIAINRNLKPEQLKDFYIESLLTCTTPQEAIDLTKKEPLEFKTKENVTFKTHDMAIAQALLWLTEQKKPVQTKELLNETAARRGKSYNPGTTDGAILSAFLKLYLVGGMRISSQAPQYVTKTSKAPKVSGLIQYQAQKFSWVTSQRSEKISLDIFSRTMSKYMDGQNDIQAIIDHMVEEVVNKNIQLLQNGQPITDKNQIRKELETKITTGIQQFGPAALLVA